jgi:hypothetical protein
MISEFRHSHDREGDVSVPDILTLPIKLEFSDILDSNEQCKESTASASAAEDSSERSSDEGEMEDLDTPLGKKRRREADDDRRDSQR